MFSLLSLVFYTKKTLEYVLKGLFTSSDKTGVVARATATTSIGALNEGEPAKRCRNAGSHEGMPRGSDAAVERPSE